MMMVDDDGGYDFGTKAHWRNLKMGLKWSSVLENGFVVHDTENGHMNNPVELCLKVAQAMDNGDVKFENTLPFVTW